VAAGTTILHERFGKGVVEKLEGTGENAKITVRFDNVGVKQLLMKFARFKIL
jgi:DNA helicase-2/ATP-dependent DNA helicase PcrA